MDRRMVKDFLASPDVANTISGGFYALLKVPELCDYVYEDIYVRLIAGDKRGACSYVMDLSSKDEDSLREWVLLVYAEVFVDFDRLVVNDAFNLVSATLCDYPFPVLPLVPNGLTEISLVRSNIKSLDGLPAGLQRLFIWQCDALNTVGVSGLFDLRHLEVNLSNIECVYVPSGITNLVLQGLVNLKWVVLNHTRFQYFDVQGCYDLDWSCLNGVYADKAVVMISETYLEINEPGFLFFIDPLQLDVF